MFATNKIARWAAGGGLMLLIPMFALRYSHELAALSQNTTFWAVGAVAVLSLFSHWRKQNFLGIVLGTLALEALAAHYLPGDFLWIPLAFVASVIGQTAIADAYQDQHSILRAALVLGHLRRGAEEIRPELNDWILERDDQGTPAPRYIRAEVIQYAKKESHEIPLGTKTDYKKPGTIRIQYDPEKVIPDAEPIRFKPLVVGPHCKQPWIIYSRFHVGDASFGSLGQNAVESLSSGAKYALRFMQEWYGQEVHGNIHTGEGGLTPYHLNGVFLDPTWQQRVAQSWAYAMSFVSDKYRRPPFPKKGHLGGGDICLEYGTAHFGARVDGGDDFDFDKHVQLLMHPNVKSFKFKISQGAKPGGGGILPGPKVTLEISKIRGIPMGKDCISPNVWKEFRTIEEMMIFGDKLRKLCGKPWGIKFCVSSPDYVRRLAQWMKDHPAGKDVLYGPDFIHIDGGEGGTGAAPPMRADFIGMSIYHSLPLVDNILREYGVRNDVILMSSGKIYSPAHLFIHLALGADIGVGVRGPMTAVGCLQAFKCHTGQCPTGVATHHPWLQRALVPRIKYLRVANYLEAMHTNLIELMRTAGVRDTYEINRSHISFVEAYGEPGGSVCYPYPTTGLADSPRKPAIPEAFGLDNFGRPLKVAA